MISNVESIRNVHGGDPASDLRAIERLRVQSWTQYPPVPFGYWFGIGAAESLLTCMAPLGRISLVLALASAGAAAGLIGAVVGKYHRERGVMPMRHVPRELRAEITAAIVVLIMVLGGLIVLAMTSWWLVNLLLGPVAFSLLGTWYERRYRRAADRAEARVA